MPPFQIVLVAPQGFSPAQALVPTAEALCFGLRRLGYEARLRANEFLHDGRNVVVGAHLLDPAVATTLPASTIVFNTEPVAARAHDLAALIPFAARFVVWDYSARNADALRGAVPGARVHVVEPGYTPEFTRVRPLPENEKDLDVLFYGAPSPYRSGPIDALRAAGIGVAHLASTYGRERDGWLARARLVLAIDFERGTPFALGRVLYPMANRCPVVVVVERADEIPVDLRAGLAVATPGEVVATCRAWLGDADARAALAERALDSLRGRDTATALARALAATDGHA